MAFIKITSLSLEYELFHDRSSSLKELLINLFHGRKYTQKRTSRFMALNNINLKIDHGDRLGIIGANGAGKSTFLKVISGILKPQVGSIVVEGNIQPLIEIAAGFNPELSGRENIYLNAYMMGFTKQQVQQKESEIISFADLGDFIDTPVKYYSSGMAVRLAFTVATLIEPEILAFDEMLSAGDTAFLEKAKRRLDEIISKAKIIILVSHDLDFISSFCNRCIVLQKGEVIFDGEPLRAIEFYKKSVGVS